MRGLFLGLLILIAAVTIAFRVVSAWFLRLERDHSVPVSQLKFESPTSATDKLPAPSLSDPATKPLSVIIPAYNEEDRLPQTLDTTLQYLARRRDKHGPTFTYEVIVVDDGSKDGTARACMGYIRQHGTDAIRLMCLKRNRGKGYAVKCGMLAARGELLLFMDADGATKVPDMERLEEQLAKALGAGADQGRTAAGWVSTRASAAGMAVGSRAHLEQEAMAKRAWYRNFLMHGFHFLVLFVTGNVVRDTQCGFKMVTRRAAQLLYPNQRLQRYCFDVELIYLARQFAIPIVEVAVNWTEIPGSKVKVTSILHMAWELVAILLGYRLTGLWQARPEVVRVLGQ